MACSVRDVGDALLVALALHLEHAGRRVEVAEVERDDFASTQATAVQDGEERRVPSTTGLGAVARLEEGAKLTGRKSPAARNTNASDRLHVSHPLIALGVDQAEGEGVLEDAS